MRIIAAYLLAVLGGNANPKKGDILKILDSVGIKGDEARIDKLIGDLAGKDLNALIAEGSAKMAALGPVGGGGGGGGSAPAEEKAGGGKGGDKGGKDDKKGGGDKKKEKEKEKEPEPEPEEEGDMGMSLFD